MIPYDLQYLHDLSIELGNLKKKILGLQDQVDDLIAVGDMLTWTEIAMLDSKQIAVIDAYVKGRVSTAHIEFERELERKANSLL